MNRKTIKTLVVGAAAAYAAAALLLTLVAAMGMLPVRADVAPGPLETTVLGSALRAAVTRNAKGDGRTPPASKQDLATGAKLYREMCSRCHGLSTGSDNTYGKSFYPPAPPLALRRSPYRDAELFWIIKHGIRNTAMPAWTNLLTDEEIRQVVAVLHDFGSLPESAKGIR